jgi:hypothetical protein
MHLNSYSINNSSSWLFFVESPGRLCVSVHDNYCYKFQMRLRIFNTILYSKHLFQQFAIDTYIKIESSRLDYIHNHQKEIRADLYQELVDSLHIGEGRAKAIGKWIVMPSSFIGGPRDMRRRYMDAMALVRRFGKPNIFLTMICNLN